MTYLRLVCVCVCNDFIKYKLTNSGITIRYLEQLDSQEFVLNEIAESYVYLGLAFGKHDADYVDAYHGPADLRSKAENSGLTLSQIISQANQTYENSQSFEHEGKEDIEIARHRYLQKELIALKTRAELLDGRDLKFDEETWLIYDVKVPEYDFGKVNKVIGELEHLLPGEGDINTKIDELRNKLAIPIEKLDLVFQKAIDEAKSRTKTRIDLPNNENFKVSYVNDKPWSGYNWFQGDAQSLIEINTDLPIYIDRVIDLAAHEGYPGHHTYHSLTEKHLFKRRGWIEWSINPLFSPTGLIGEGSANYGIEVAFPGHERIKYEKEELAPIAGIDSNLIEKYYRMNELRRDLRYLTLQLGRLWVDKKISDEEYVTKHTEITLLPNKFGEQSLKFLSKYRAYIINYISGLDLVTDYMIRNGGTDNNPDRRWELYIDILSKPTLPSDLI